MERVMIWFIRIIEFCVIIPSKTRIRGKTEKLVMWSLVISNLLGTREKARSPSPPQRPPTVAPWLRAGELKRGRGWRDWRDESDLQTEGKEILVYASRLISIVQSWGVFLSSILIRDIGDLNMVRFSRRKADFISRYPGYNSSVTLKQMLGTWPPNHDNGNLETSSARDNGAQT